MIYPLVGFHQVIIIMWIECCTAIFCLLYFPPNAWLIIICWKQKQLLLIRRIGTVRVLQCNQVLAKKKKCGKNTLQSGGQSSQTNATMTPLNARKSRNYPQNSAASRSTGFKASIHCDCSGAEKLARAKPVNEPILGDLRGVRLLVNRHRALADEFKTASAFFFNFHKIKLTFWRPSTYWINEQTSKVDCHVPIAPSWRHPPKALY